MTRHGAVATLAFALLVGGTAVPVHAGDDAPPEPDGYRMEHYRGPTPATLAGARVLSDDEALALWRDGKAVFIDVLPRPRKPAGLAAGTPWRVPPRHGIPGSTWLPNVGYGALSPGVDAYYRRNLERLTGGDRATPLVLFCLAQCWMSWNAAKRALAYGYTDVSWYPDGTDGWAFAGGPLEIVEPVPLGD